MRNRIYNFMLGRYGVDSFGKFLFGVWIALAVANVFFRNNIVQIVVFVLCLLVIFRMLSRNFTARRKENELFLKYSAGARTAFTRLKKWAELQRVRFEQRKTHRFFTCPSCGATLRVPRKKGLMEIRCVRCGNRFTKKIR